MKLKSALMTWGRLNGAIIAAVGLFLGWKGKAGKALAVNLAVGGLMFLIGSLLRALKIGRH